MIRVRILVPVLTQRKLRMAGFAEYLKESYTELSEKVTWPTWSELQNSAVITLVASLLIALIILAMDESAGNLLKLMYKSFA